MKIFKNENDEDENSQLKLSEDAFDTVVNWQLWNFLEQKRASSGQRYLDIKFYKVPSSQRSNCDIY